MAMNANQIAELIKAALPDATVRMEDLRGDGDHYQATIISSAFIGLSRIAQHQLVYKALQGRMGAAGADSLHALSLTTKIPE